MPNIDSQTPNLNVASITCLDSRNISSRLSFPLWCLLGVDSPKLSAHIIDFHRTSTPRSRRSRARVRRPSYRRISPSETSSIFHLPSLSVALSPETELERCQERLALPFQRVAITNSLWHDSCKSPYPVFRECPCKIAHQSHGCLS